MAIFLKTERLLLRNLKEADADAIYAWRNDPQCREFQRWEDTSREAVMALVRTFGGDEFLSDKEEQHYAVCIGEQLVGDLSYFYTEEDTCITLGITIAPRFQRKGYAREILRAVIGAIQSRHPWLDIVALIDKENRASIALFEHLGFYRECYAESIASYVYVIDGKKKNRFYNTNDLRDGEIFLDLERTCDAQPEKRWLPAYYFGIFLLNGEKIGYCDLRIGHNDKTYIGGNIGYGIDEPHRGHHYAAKACALLLRQARKHDMDHLFVTCGSENRAAARTCELAGGSFLEIADVPQDNELYEDLKKVRVYRFDI